ISGGGVMRPDTDAACVRRDAPSRAHQAYAREPVCPGAGRAFSFLALDNHAAIKVVRLACKSLDLVEGSERRRHVFRSELPKLPCHCVAAFYKRWIGAEVEERPVNRCRLNRNRRPRPAL